MSDRNKINLTSLFVWVLSLNITSLLLSTTNLAAGYINTGSSCTVTMPDFLATGDLMNINNCRSGLCSGGICVDQCTGIDQGAFGQPCSVMTAKLCCADTFHCDLANILRNNSNTGAQPGTQCCIAGAVSPGNQKMVCHTDADCCQNAICTPNPDLSAPDQKSYCVTCATSGGTCKDGVLCCNNQQLNCVSGLCESCIGQNCAVGTGAACCPDSVIPGITCGTNQAGASTTCCVKTSFGCTIDQDCCAGNNCIIDSTSNNSQGVCAACGSKIGDSCSLKQPCCSSSPTLSCLITDSGLDVTGTCQNISCVLNSDCNSGYYCDLTTDPANPAKPAVCATCLNTTCTGTDGAACDHDCDPDLYECQSANCVSKVTADSDASGWLIASAVVGGTVVVGAIVIGWKLYQARNDTGTFKNSEPRFSASFFTTQDSASAASSDADRPGYAIGLTRTPADQAVLLQALKTAAAEDYEQAVTAAIVVEGTNYPTSEGILKAYKVQGFGKNFVAIWSNYMQIKIAAIDPNKPMDQVTIEILRALKRAGLLQRINATSYNTVTLKSKQSGNIVIKFPENSADYITQNLLQTLPDRTALTPDSPELNIQTAEFIKNMVAKAFTESLEKSTERPADLNVWLNNSKNMDLMRDIWSATYFKLVRDNIAEPKAADIIKYLIENTSFRLLFNDDSPFNNSTTALDWLAAQTVPAGSDYFVEAFKQFPPSYQQAMAGDNSYERAVSDQFYDKLIAGLKTQDPVALRNFRIAAILAGKGNFGSADSFTSDELRDMAYSYREALRGWAPSDYASYTSAKLFRPV